MVNENHRGKEERFLFTSYTIRYLTYILVESNSNNFDAYDSLRKRISIKMNIFNEII